ncbi:MAG TPA: sugar phosphate isomerase/epimerase family protein [Bryobacterales bacterium]|nr:sugar phosphate isomerase/epimerase family protein [Bryobacterales bacterium]
MTMTRHAISRRSFLSLAAAAPLASAAPRGKHIPIGLELYSVRNELKQDLMGTVRAAAKMGYECVEFYAPYYEWNTDYAKQVRKLLDDLGIHCFSTHNNGKNFAPENLSRAIELNQIIGSKIIVMASPGRVQGLDGWKGVADTLNRAAEKLKPEGLRAGYHNHQAELVAVDGRLPMEVLAAGTTKDVVLQLDTGPCLEHSFDPVAWINKNPGRIRCMHVKDWSPDPAKGPKVILGDGAGQWKKIFQAAEKTGGIEYYLIEQEGADTPPLETVQLCLAAFQKLHGA